MSVVCNDFVTQKLIHHFFGKKMKTSLANKNPNKMHHYKNRLKSGYGHMFSIYVRCYTEAGQNVEIISNFFAILTQIDYERVSDTECWAVSRERDILHISEEG